ncbi:flavin reductase family protein [Rhodohalobacter mucosus]|uniref:Flavin reductase n=1 Tax=Rhodohalobacter mucosus TaxID=2079485 RepID=A0A316TVU9_9BACT|nr:flavin reductase family protein [Rhodohalobacter mucosus]PWN06644.1 flavin reductase [Rhodohalobacter mucosus]
MTPKTKTIDFESVDNRTRYKFMTAAVAPRPICFASTIDGEGRVNLSPFSYFNMFSSTPPVMIFSPSRSGRSAEHKDTYHNVKEVAEVVINIVNSPMLEQMSLASAAWEKGVNEFDKAGFTEVPSDRVRPPRVMEAPIAFECVVDRVIELGAEGGAGNLVIARAVSAHINEEYLDKDGYPDQVKLKLIARMGGDWYCHANSHSMFQLARPGGSSVLGVDGLPDEIRSSAVLTGSHLGRLGNLDALPSEVEIKKASGMEEVKKILEELHDNSDTRREAMHHLGRKMIEEGKVKDALAVMMIGKSAE